MRKSRYGSITGIVVVFLIVVAILLLLFRNHSPFGSQNTSFAVPAESEITKIEFTAGSEKMVLEKVEDKWLLNGKLETRKSSISFITRVLKEIEIKSPVSVEIFREEAGVKEPVRVRAYSNRKLITDFLVYKTTSNVYGNIMKKKVSSKPFIVHVPGFDGEIGSAFTMNELYWQPYTIFNLLPSEILSVEVQSDNFGDSFTIKRENAHLQLSDATGDLTGWDSTRVNRYISYFTFIPFESWVIGMPDSLKSVTSQKPFYSIVVKTTNSRMIDLSLWERKMSDGSIDTDRLYGKTGLSDELFIVRFYDIDPVLKRKEYFYNNQ